MMGLIYGQITRTIQQFFFFFFVIYLLPHKNVFTQTDNASNAKPLMSIAILGHFPHQTLSTNCPCSQQVKSVLGSFSQAGTLDDTVAVRLDHALLNECWYNLWLKLLLEEVVLVTPLLAMYSSKRR
jgi:hypothetical protein